jgi:hypothetical protein
MTTSFWLPPSSLSTPHTNYRASSKRRRPEATGFLIRIRPNHNRLYLIIVSRERMRSLRFPQRRSISAGAEPCWDILRIRDTLWTVSHLSLDTLGQSPHLGRRTGTLHLVRFGRVVPSLSSNSSPSRLSVPARVVRNLFRM